MTPAEHADRLQFLADAVAAESGEWTTRRVQRLYRTAGHAVPLRSAARRYLVALQQRGLLALDDRDPDRRFYTRIELPGGPA